MNHSEHSENSENRSVRKSDLPADKAGNQKAGTSDSPALRSSELSGTPVRDVSPNGTLRPSIPSFPKVITTPNPEMIVAAQSDPEFLKALQAADLAIPDGVGIVWALKILSYRFSVVGFQSQVNRFSVSRSGTGKPKTDRPETENRKLKTDNRTLSPLSGLDFMESLIREPQKVGPFVAKVMLLGGKPGVAEKAAEILSENSENSDSRNLSPPAGGSDNQKAGNSGSPALRPSDSSGSPSIPSFLKIKSINGPEDISRVSKSDNDRLITSINRARPDLLFVAFGHGQQEKWLVANRPRLRVGIAMGVGGALDQIADPSLRPPAYINSIGLGWLYRLLRQPWRWKRQLALIKFAGMVSNVILSPDGHRDEESRRDPSLRSG